MNGNYFLFDNGHIRKDVVEQTNKEKSKIGIGQDLLHTRYFNNPYMLSCDVRTRVVGPTSQHDVPAWDVDLFYVLNLGISIKFQLNFGASWSMELLNLVGMMLGECQDDNKDN